MVILYILLVFAAVILARTLMFTPPKEEQKVFEEIELDGAESIRNLFTLVRCRTVSYSNPVLEEEAEFEKLIGLLPELYPNVWKNCPLQRFEGRGLLFRWQGRTEGDPAVLMAHYDVVPVEEENWQKPAFDAIAEDGVMWGRGTLDTKVTFNGILSGAENLIRQGFQPEHDIYFAFSGGEEINGPGAENIVRFFQEKGVNLRLVLDEGGAVVEDVFPGVKGPCALIGIAEKGLLNLEYSVSGAGGHASAPAPHTPVGKLALACAKVEAHPFKMHLTKPVLEMFNTLGRHSSFVYRMIFANLWAFGWVLNLLTKKSGGELNALLRTTVAFTQMSGSKAPNVIPPKASMVSNLRLNPADSVKSAVDYIRKTIRDEDIRLTCLEAMEPSPISRTDCESWDIICNAVSGTWEGCLVSPYLMVQCSDSRHYSSISDRVYRFSALEMTAEERRSIHGNDEHIRLECIPRAAEFFMRVMKQL